MPKNLGDLIYALIPGTIGILMLALPGLFVKFDSPVEKRQKLRKVGMLLIVLSAVFVLLAIVQ